MADWLISGVCGALFGALAQGIYNHVRMEYIIGKAFKDGINVGLALKGLHQRRGGEE